MGAAATLDKPTKTVGAVEDSLAILDDPQRLFRIIKLSKARKAEAEIRQELGERAKPININVLAASIPINHQDITEAIDGIRSQLKQANFETTTKGRLTAEYETRLRVLARQVQLLIPKR